MSYEYLAASLATRMQSLPHRCAVPCTQLASVHLAQSRGHLEEALAKPHQDATPALLPASALAALSLAVTALLFVLFLLSKRRLREVSATLLVTLFMGLALVGVAIARWSLPPAARAPEPTPSELAQTEAEIHQQGDRPATEDGEAEPERGAAPDSDGEAEAADAAAETDETETELETETETDAAEPEATENGTAGEVAAAIANANARATGSPPQATADRARSSPPPAAPPARPATPRPQPTGGGRAATPPAQRRPAPVVFRPLLQRGDRGGDVALLQQLLARLGYYDRPADGEFGRWTEAAVAAFQRDRNLAVDGKVGFSTCNILRALALELDDSPLDGAMMQCH